MDDVIDALEKLPNGTILKHISENAGTVGGIIKIVAYYRKSL
jgi:hypothetical protein